MNIVLESVGCVVDDESITHPIEDNGTCVNMTPDVAVHIQDCTNEWWEGMTLEDAENLFRYLADNTELYYSEGYMSWAIRMYEVVQEANGINTNPNYEDTWHYSNSLGGI